jgi:hypothetical protein
MLGQLSPTIFLTLNVVFFTCLAIFVHPISLFSYFPVLHFVMFINIPQCPLLSIRFVTFESQTYQASYHGIIMV